MAPISVLIADDHPVIREGIRASLSRRRNLLIVGEAGDGLEAVEKAAALKPDVVIMDVSMPGINGFEAARRLAKRAPASRVLFLTMHEDPGTLREAVRSGARGYLLKNSAPEELVRAIASVHAGKPFFPAAVSAALLGEVVEGKGILPSQYSAALTPREREVLILVAGGLSSKEIARRMNIGTRTVETHRERIGSKLGLRGAAAFTRYAIKHGLAPLE